MFHGTSLENRAWCYTQEIYFHGCDSLINLNVRSDDYAQLNLTKYKMKFIIIQYFVRTSFVFIDWNIHRIDIVMFNPIYKNNLRWLVPAKSML